MYRMLGLAIAIQLFLPAFAGAQRFACGGHQIHWIGGAPRASLDRGPHAHEPPSMPEPEGMSARDRELWDAIVYDAYDRPMADPDRPDVGGLPLGDRRTIVLSANTMSRIDICIQSSDDSYTGERLAAYANEEWWEEHFTRFTNARWRGTIDIAECTGEPMNGWVYVREGTLDEYDWGNNTLAFASSWRSDDAHGVWGGDGNWYSSEIVWHPERVTEQTEAAFESSLAHELGHVLGLFHAPPGSGFAMVSGETTTWPDRERWLSQWAYEIGPNVQYPGLIRETPVPALPLVSVLLLAGLLLAAGKSVR